jgi:hypothetical protein
MPPGTSPPLATRWYSSPSSATGSSRVSARSSTSRRERHPALIPFVSEFSVAVENGLTVVRICEELKRSGFTPDLVAGHNGWGEILYVKDCWPSVPLLGYFEFFYRPRDSDLDFDPEFPPARPTGCGSAPATRSTCSA